MSQNLYRRRTTIRMQSMTQQVQLSRTTSLIRRIRRTPQVQKKATSTPSTTQVQEQSADIWIATPQARPRPRAQPPQGTRIRSTPHLPRFPTQTPIPLSSIKTIGDIDDSVSPRRLLLPFHSQLLCTSECTTTYTFIFPFQITTYESINIQSIFIDH